MLIINGELYIRKRNGKVLERVEIEKVKENKKEFLKLFTTDELFEEVIERLEEK